MRKILLLSDTHGHLDDFIKKHISEADEVWHAGDIGNTNWIDEVVKLKPLQAVYGNIDNHDIRKIYPENLFFTCEELRVFITHIGGYPKKYPARLHDIFKSIPVDLFICGHSHILKVMYDHQYQFLHMNPGAIGVYGFHQVRTMLKFEIHGKDIKNLFVIEKTSRA